MAIREGVEGLPFRITYECDDLQQYWIERVEGEVPERPFANVAPGVLRVARLLPLQGDQLERWQACVREEREEWDRLGRTEVILEQVQFVLRERGSWRQAERLPDGPMSLKMRTVSSLGRGRHGHRGFGAVLEDKGALKIMRVGWKERVVAVDHASLHRKRLIPIEVWKKAKDMPFTELEREAVGLASAQSPMDRTLVQKQLFRDRVVEVEAALREGRDVPVREKQGMPVPDTVRRAEAEVRKRVEADAGLKELRDHAEKFRLVENSPHEAKESVASLEWRQELARLRKQAMQERQEQERRRRERGEDRGR